MIATTRGVLVLAVIAAIFGIAVVATSPRKHVAVDRAIMPGFVPERVTELRFQRADTASDSAEAREIRVVRSGEGWRIDSPSAVADSAAIEATLFALRGAVWQRRVPAAEVGAPRSWLDVSDGTRSMRIGMAHHIEGTSQSWLVVGKYGLLVDSWVARAIAPPRDTLHVRRPFAGVASANAIVAHALRLEGTRMTKPHQTWLDPTLVRGLVDALAALEVVTLSDLKHGALTFEVLIEGTPSVRAAEVGECPVRDRILLAITTGNGCVERTQWERVKAAIAALQREPADLVDRRPLPITPVQLILTDSVMLDLTGKPRLRGAGVGSGASDKPVVEGDADPDRVAELLAALTTPVAVAAPPPPSKTARPAIDLSVGTIVATDRAGVTVTLELSDTTVRRRDDVVAFQPPPEVLRLLRQRSDALRDPVLWREDPSSVEAITLDRVVYKRGAVLGEWLREGNAVAKETDLVDAVVTASASVRAPQVRAALPKTEHTLTLTFAPPTGQPFTKTLSIARPTGSSCPAVADGAHVAVDLALCTAVFALAAAN